MLTLQEVMKPKILVVDDDRPVLLVTAEILKRDEYDVVAVTTLTEAIACLEREKFQLVISDYRLSGESGEDVVLTARQKQPETPVFIITGNSHEMPAWLSDGRAVARVFSKPFPPANLLAAVREVLGAVPGREMVPHLPPINVQASIVLPRGVEEMVHRVVDQESIIAITDKKGTIVYANDRFCEISGYSRSELLGQNHRLLKSGAHPPVFYKMLWGTILSGRTWRGEICNRAKDGRLYYVDTTITPLREEGLITHFIALRTDITARKEAEQALAEQGKREEEDRRMASLGRMADGVLHDLNNILTGVMGIASESLAENRDEMLHDSIGRMAQLTRTLRDYSTGRPTEPEPFRLNPLVACACSLGRHRKGAPRVLIIDEQLSTTQGVKVIGNEGQIFEVVLNLVVNAVEASSASVQPKILVRTEIENGRAVIRVEDNGSGVPESVAQTIFEPFTSTKGPGRGIGLSAAKNIVVAHGGELCLERAGGGGLGACFKLSLPAQLASIRRPQEMEPIASTGAKRVVLVSEDEVDVRRVITNDAGRIGLTVMHAGDMADLLALAAQMKEVLAAAIIDSCEVESDHGAVACLRRISPGLPIILISATLTSRGKRITPWGEVENMPKPFRSEEMVRALTSTINSPSMS
jgi:PAS domain S-box-containing protein